MQALELRVGMNQISDLFISGLWLTIKLCVENFCIKTLSSLTYFTFYPKVVFLYLRIAGDVKELLFCRLSLNFSGCLSIFVPLIAVNFICPSVFLFVCPGISVFVNCFAHSDSLSMFYHKNIYLNTSVDHLMALDCLSKTQATSNKAGKVHY